MNIQNGANIKQSDNAHGIPITRIETLSNGIFNRDKLGYADIYEVDRYSKYILQDGDILMSHINSAKYLGRSVAYKRTDRENIIHGMNILRLIPIRSVIISSYAEYFFKSFYFKKQIIKITKKAVNQASFTTSDLKRLSIPVPPLPEQKRIVAELDLLSNIIEKQKAQLKELDILAQSIFYDMFGDPVINEKGWDVKKIRELSTNKLSYGSGASAIEYDNDVRYIRITDINENGNLNEIKVSPNKFEKKFLLTEGDILFARSGATVGKTYMHISSSGKCIYAGYLIRMIPNRDFVLPEYIHAYTKTNYYLSFIKQSQKIAAQPNINAQ